jgi:hypothetical protein
MSVLHYSFMLMRPTVMHSHVRSHDDKAAINKIRLVIKNTFLPPTIQMNNALQVKCTVNAKNIHSDQ